MHAERLEERVGNLLKAHGLTLALAESCTGGLVGHTITQVAGSSDYFLGGVIAYSNRAKVELLGVKRATLNRCGAASSETAAEMAEGAQRIFGADCALSTTGIAGPTGGSDATPVGLVYIGMAMRGRTVTARHLFSGTRHKIKTQASRAALAMLCDHINKEYELPHP
jgi:PncC family amidohydrolase